MRIRALFAVLSVLLALQLADAMASRGAPALSPPVTAAAATSNTLHLRVQSARAWIPAGLAQGQAIPSYHWLITEDDTGDPTNYPGSATACKPQSLGGDPNYPANCQWPSIHDAKGGTSAEIVAQGDESMLNETTGIDTSTWPAPNDHNPRHSYLISVMAEGFDIPGCTITATVTCHVDGFKIDGQWFTTPLSGTVVVSMQPYPLPFTTVRMAVWNDLQTNGAYDTGEPNLAGFEGHIDDVLGPVTTDWYGNPICTKYQHDGSGLMLFDNTAGKPLIQQIGGHCLSDADGVITIPYLGPDRYASTVTPPAGQTWYQTSTLEGWHDWDTWSIEGWNGYDPEFVQGAEPFPFAEFGFVQLHSTLPATGTGAIKGTVVGTGEFAPQTGGLTIGGGPGRFVIENVKNPLISLIDTGQNDNSVFIGRGNADGSFQIDHVPDGDYVLTFWDEDQAYLLTQSSVSIVGGAVVDMGVLDIASWHSRVEGRVCFDTNRNGKCEAGEQGIPNLPLNLLGRDNSVQFYGDNTAVTDNQGYYKFPRAYPLGQWVVTQGYWEQFYTVGVTYQTNNQPTETTVMANGGFVDVSTYNLIGMITRLDFAVHTYETNPALGPTNGGIVGEVVYDSTRNELDARFSGNESYQPGIPGIPVHLFAPVRCTPGDPTLPVGISCTPTTTAFGTANYLTGADGAYVKYTASPDHYSGTPIDLAEPYISETWLRPTDCVARGVDGTPVQENVLPPSTGGHDCLEAPLMSSQVGNNSVGDFMQVDGNYGFTAACFDGAGAPGSWDPVATAADPNGDLHCMAGFTVQELKPGDYLVEVVSPTDPATGRPVWDVTKEEDINIASGDQFVAPGETPVNPPTPAGAAPPTVAPAIPPFLCSGPTHTVNVVADRGDAHFDPLDPHNTQGVYNPDFIDIGGSPYEGTRMPLCGSRLVTVRNGRSATPNFFLHPQDVPLPGRIMGLIVDDLNLSVKPNELFYGEKYGIPGIPIGIYDFSDRLVKTVYSDPNGVFEVTLPSTSSYNCPLPAGPCPGIYRFYGNDPGQPGHPNPGYNPNYRSIGAFFEVWPGVTLPADLAPSPVAFGIENPATQTTHPAQCLINDPAQPTAPKIPEFYSVSRPYVSAAAGRSITINGLNFGATQGSGKVTLNGTALPAGAITSWSDTTIGVNVPAAFPTGPAQLLVTAANGQTTENGVTMHVIGGGYNPTIFEVGPGKTYSPTDPNPTFAAHAIQRALDAAASSAGTGPKLVVVYPGVPGSFNPLGSYYENVIMHSRVKLQGVGPGNGGSVPGTVLDGLGYGTDGTREAAWAASLAALGNVIGPGGAPVNAATATVPEGEVILAIATNAAQYNVAANSDSYAAIDGLLVQNGDVMDFIGNTNNLGNGVQVGGTNNTPTNPNQGGGIVAFASTEDLRITNNILRSNAGAYAGAIRLGTPLVGDNNLDDIHIAYNRIIHNGGSNLAGAIGVFTGAQNYEISHNDICGNFSAEYGGGISHFGLSAGGSIHDNRVYFNGSYDEGGGILVAGEPPLTPTGVSAGAGAVDVFNNTIQANLANDDGGGLRLLTAGNFPFNIYNNFIVNNVSTHEGGGVAIDNAPNVRFFNNTVMSNITTATAATSNGQPAPAGFASAGNDDFFQATLPGGSPLFSNPLMFNNIFWDNRAGHWDGANVVGIGGQVWSGGVLVPDPTPVNNWDMGVPGTASLLSPTNSVLQTTLGSNTSPTNVVGLNPLVNSPFVVGISALAWRGNPTFVANAIVAQDVPESIMGDYHLSGTTSPAYNAGAASKAVPSYQQPPATLAAPTSDIDGQARPALGGFDAGADEFGGANADLSITKDDGVTTVAPGGLVTYTISVSNAGPFGVALAPVTDTVPALLTGVTWTCTAPGGSLCGAASGGGNITTTVTLPSGGSATFTVTGTVVASPTTFALVNTASIATPAGTNDPTPANNSATDTDFISIPLPSLTLLDNFNRANANTLGGSWSQITLLGFAAIRVNGNQAQVPLLPGSAIWNVPAAGFGAHQAAAFTFPVAPVDGSALLLKGSGGTANNPANFIRVQYQTSGQVVVATTNNGNALLPTYTTRGTLSATFAAGDTLSAVAFADGTVMVYKTTGVTTTFVGGVSIPTSGPGSWTQGTAGGRIGLQLPFNARVDDFRGGTLP